MFNQKITDNTDKLEAYLSENEDILLGFKLLRDEVILTNIGLYLIDVQGVSGKKVAVRFYPIKNCEGIEFETAGTFDLDSDLKIYFKGQEPVILKIKRANQENASQIIRYIKKNL